MTPSNNARRMCSVFVTVKLLSKLSHDKRNMVTDSRIMELFSMLLLTPELPSCPEISIVSDLISEDCQKNIASILVQFLNVNLPASNRRSAEWLYAIPLIHILEKRIKPFGRPALTSKDIRWTIDGHIDFKKKAGSSAVLK